MYHYQRHHEYPLNYVDTFQRPDRTLVNKFRAIYDTRSIDELTEEEKAVRVVHDEVYVFVLSLPSL